MHENTVTLYPLDDRSLYTVMLQWRAPHFPSSMSSLEPDSDSMCPFFLCLLVLSCQVALSLLNSPTLSLLVSVHCGSTFSLSHPQTLTQCISVHCGSTHSLLHPQTLTRLASVSWCFTQLALPQTLDPSVNAFPVQGLLRPPQIQM